MDNLELAPELQSDTVASAARRAARQRLLTVGSFEDLIKHARLSVKLRTLGSGPAYGCANGAAIVTRFVEYDNLLHVGWVWYADTRTGQLSHREPTRIYNREGFASMLVGWIREGTTLLPGWGVYQEEGN